MTLFAAFSQVVLFVQVVALGGYVLVGFCEFNAAPFVFVLVMMESRLGSIPLLYLSTFLLSGMLSSCLVFISASFVFQSSVLLCTLASFLLLLWCFF